MNQEIGFTRHQTLQCLNLGLPNLQSCEKEILLIISHPVHGTVITTNKLSTLMCKRTKKVKGFSIGKSVCEKENYFSTSF